MVGTPSLSRFVVIVVVAGRLVGESGECELVGEVEAGRSSQRPVAVPRIFGLPFLPGEGHTFRVPAPPSWPTKTKRKRSLEESEIQQPTQPTHS